MPTLTRQVSQDSDDGMRNSSSSFSTTTSEFTAGDFSSSFFDYSSGARFQDIDIPQGSLITAAHIELFGKHSSGSGFSTVITGELTTDATTFSTDSDYTSRTRTSNSSGWSPSSWLTGNWNVSSDISAIIQEIVNQSGWVPGNALVVFWDDAQVGFQSQRRLTAGGSGRFGDPAEAPKLVIDYQVFQPVNPPSIPSAEAHGTPIAISIYSVDAFSISSTEAFGVPDVQSTYDVLPNVIPSAEAFGTPELTQAHPIRPAGMPSVEAFGNATLTTGPVVVDVPAIPSAEEFGISHVVSGIIIPTGISSDEAFGVPIFTTGVEAASGRTFARPVFTMTVGNPLTAGRVVTRTMTVQVASGPDDTQSWNNASITDASNQFGAGDFSASFMDYEAGMRVYPLIPAGATIEAAYLEVFGASETGTVHPTRITGELSDNAAPWVNDYSEFSSRPRTSVAVDWDVTDWMNGAWNRSPDISAVIQEIVNHMGWDAGNALALFWGDQLSGFQGEQRLIARSADFDPDFAPRIVVTYTAIETDHERIATLDIPPMTALSWQTQLPGGFSDAKIGLTGREHQRVYAYLPIPVDAPLFGHVEIQADGTRVYEGRIEERDRPGGDIRGLSATGYGFAAVSDDYYESDDQTMVTSATALLEVLRAAAPLVRIGAIDDPGVLHALSDFDGMTPGQVIDQLIKEGGEGGIPWDYLVYEQRLLSFLARIPPAQPDYSLPIDETVQLRESVRDSYSTAKLRFGSGNDEQVTPELSRSQFTNRHGFERRKLLSGSSPSLAVATQFVETWLTEHSQPEISATVKRDQWRGLEMLGGDLQPQWLVRAGQWLLLGDYGPLVIERTSFDGMKGTLSLELGKPLRGPLAERLARIAETDTSVRTRRNPVTGARES